MAYQGYYQRKSKESTDVQDTTELEKDTVGKTENFFTRHVKLITFLICLLVFLVCFGPWNIMRFIAWKEARDARANPFPEEQLEYIVEKGDRVTWKDFGDYSYEVIAQNACYSRQYVIGDGAYYMIVSSEEEGSQISSLILIRTSDYETVDIINEEAHDFFKK